MNEERVQAAMRTIGEVWTSAMRTYAEQMNAAPDGRALRELSDAMRAEGIDDVTVDRVMKRLIWGER
jgi:hypothetical protein